MRLTETLPWEDWVRFEKGINEKTGLNSCVIDQQGVRITAYHQWATPLCSVIRGDSNGRATVCDKLGLLLDDVWAEKGGLMVSKCLAGMLVLCVPVFWQGTMIGLVGGCGMLPENGALNPVAVSKATGFGIAKIQAVSKGIGILQAREIEALGKYLTKRIEKLMEH